MSLALDGPADAVPLALLADLKADLGLTDDSSNTRLTRLLLDASSMALAYIGQPILSCLWTEEIQIERADRLRQIVLSARPLLSIQSLKRNGADWTAEQISGLVIDRKAGLLSCPPEVRHHWHPGHYVLTYQAGYVPPSMAEDSTVQTGTLPPVISRAVILTASALWAAGDRDPNLKSESVQGVGSTSWATVSGTGGMPQSAADMLKQFRE
ncbi:hypothetical protein AD953_08375 [Acetobacter malorum]|uniref:Phage associated protein n=1 Tax=Acetobacter malorum TaxID=178901 RepID=A0A149V4Q7_9PROT|nr:hypothetical protein AD953_08375 [Acetobacter malorum]